MNQAYETVKAFTPRLQLGVVDIAVSEASLNPIVHLAELDRLAPSTKKTLGRMLMDNVRLAPVAEAIGEFGEIAVSQAGLCVAASECGEPFAKCDVTLTRLDPDDSTQTAKDLGIVVLNPSGWLEVYCPLLKACYPLYPEALASLDLRDFGARITHVTIDTEEDSIPCYEYENDVGDFVEVNLPLAEDAD